MKTSTNDLNIKEKEIIQNNKNNSNEKDNKNKLSKTPRKFPLTENKEEKNKSLELNEDEIIKLIFI